VANVFFLIIVVLASISTISAFSPYATLMAIVGILGVQAIKDGYEDYHRIVADDKANAIPGTVWRGGAWTEVTWAEMEVGDLIKLKSDDSVPADVLILASQTAEKRGPNKEQGVVMVDTAQLDGETNLKMCQAIPETSQMYDNVSREMLSGAIDKIQCDGPNPELEKLNGQIDFNNGLGSKPLNRANFLLRGVKVKQTFVAYGIITHTGAESKIIQNSDSEPPKKRTHMDRLLNNCILFCFVFTFAVCFVMAIGMGFWVGAHDADWYLELESSNTEDGLGYFKPSNGFVTAVLGFLTWIQLMAYMIPIPLYVTVEMIKLFSGNFMDGDLEMYCPILDKGAKCRNSSVPEELGQVQYVLSDKTGTLTQNKMELLKFSAGGDKFGAGITEIEVARHRLEFPSEPDIVDESVNKPKLAHEDPEFRFYDPAVSDFAFLEPKNQDVENFLLGLALCHEVVPEVNKDGSMKYNAASPDDGALVVGAKNLGFKLKSCENAEDGVGKAMVVARALKQGDEVEWIDETYILLHTIGFSSERKRMSNIFRMPDGSYRVYMKGADNFIYDRLTEAHRTSEAMKTTLSNIANFGDDGLRTLMYSQMDIPTSTYTAWATQWAEAQLIADEKRREDVCTKLAPQVEEGHMPIGASAIEDKLQENVGDTIQHLSDAGIQTWVLTGDKTNTAIMIGFACCLLKPSMERVIIKQDRAHLRTDEEALDPATGKSKFLEKDAGNRIAENLVEAEDYYLNGRKKCPRTGKHEVCTHWYRENKEWSDDGDTARDFDICEEAFKAIPAGELMKPKLNKQGEQVLDDAGVAQKEEAYYLFKPVEHYDTGNLAMVIEGNALSQIGIGRVPIDMPEVTVTDEIGESIKGQCGKAETDAEKAAAFLLLSDEDRFSIMFTNFAKMCKAVVCCRVSPSQKAEVCKCVKKYLKKTTLCIGDGANDVPMILQAHVGVGIAGVEGSQAVNNADFALCKFRDLEKIVLVHGRWAYKRLAYVCLYILYKNVAFSFIFAVNAMYSGYSGQLFYDEWAMALYNVLFSAFPVVMYGFFEQDVNRLTSVLFPISYRPGQTDGVLNFTLFMWFFAEAIFQSLVIFYFIFDILGYHEMQDGTTFGIWDAGNAAYTANILVVTIRIAMDTQHYTNYHLFAYIMSVLVWFIFIILYSEMPPGQMGNAYDTSDNMYFSARALGTSALFYLTQPVTVVVCLLPTMIHQGWVVVMTPSLKKEDYASDKEGFMRFVPGFMLPDRKGDVSIMYHLRHYMKIPVRPLPPLIARYSAHCLTSYIAHAGNPGSIDHDGHADEPGRPP